MICTKCKLRLGAYRVRCPDGNVLAIMCRSCTDSVTRAIYVEGAMATDIVRLPEREKRQVG